MDFTYKQTGTQDFASTVDAVERIVRSHGFVLSRTHDIRATLASKGFQIQPLMIFEVVVGASAGPSGIAERDLVNVCRLHIYVEDDSVRVTAIRPTIMSKVFPDAEAQEEAAAFEDAVVQLVDAVVGK